MEIKSKRCQECGTKRSASSFGVSKQTKDGLFDRCRPCIKGFNDNFMDSQRETIILDKIRNKLSKLVPRTDYDFEDICQEVAIRVYKYYDENKSTLKQHLSVIVKREIGRYRDTQHKQLLAQADWMNNKDKHFSGMGSGNDRRNVTGVYSITNPEGFTADDAFEALIYNKASIDYSTDSRSPNPLESLLEAEALGQMDNFEPKDQINGQIYKSLLQGKMQDEIALKLGLDQSNISRRIKRIRGEFKHELERRPKI